MEKMSLQLKTVLTIRIITILMVFWPRGCHADPEFDFTNAFDDPKTGLKCLDGESTVSTLVHEKLLECIHRKVNVCHYAFSTKFKSHRIEECNDNYEKNCQIVYRQDVVKETLEHCYQSMKRECSDKVDLSQMICRIFPESQCTTRYVEKEESKLVAATSCFKAPRQYCAATGCQFVLGERQCNNKTQQSTVDVPEENCDLVPQKTCQGANKLVPFLEPEHVCGELEREICSFGVSAVRPGTKPLITKWCLRSDDVISAAGVKGVASSDVGRGQKDFQGDDGDGNNDHFDEDIYDIVDEGQNDLGDRDQESGKGDKRETTVDQFVSTFAATTELAHDDSTDSPARLVFEEAIPADLTQVLSGIDADKKHLLKVAKAKGDEAMKFAEKNALAKVINHKDKNRTVGNTIIIKSKPEALELFRIKNVPSNALANAQRQPSRIQQQNNDASAFEHDSESTIDQFNSQIQQSRESDIGSLPANNAQKFANNIFEKLTGSSLPPGQADFEDRRPKNFDTIDFNTPSKYLSSDGQENENSSPNSFDAQKGQNVGGFERGGAGLGQDQKIRKNQTIAFPASPLYRVDVESNLNYGGHNQAGNSFGVDQISSSGQEEGNGDVEQDQVVPSVGGVNDEDESFTSVVRPLTQSLDFTSGGGQPAPVGQSQDGAINADGVTSTITQGQNFVNPEISATAEVNQGQNSYNVDSESVDIQGQGQVRIGQDVSKTDQGAPVGQGQSLPIGEEQSAQIQDQQLGITDTLQPSKLSTPASAYSGQTQNVVGSDVSAVSDPSKLSTPAGAYTGQNPNFVASDVSVVSNPLLQSGLGTNQGQVVIQNLEDQNFPAIDRDPGQSFVPSGQDFSSSVVTSSENGGLFEDNNGKNTQTPAQVQSFIGENFYNGDSFVNGGSQTGAAGPVEFLSGQNLVSQSPVLGQSNLNGGDGVINTGSQSFSSYASGQSVVARDQLSSQPGNIGLTSFGSQSFTNSFASGDNVAGQSILGETGYASQVRPTDDVLSVYKSTNQEINSFRTTREPVDGYSRPSGGDFKPPTTLHFGFKPLTTVSFNLVTETPIKTTQGYFSSPDKLMYGFSPLSSVGSADFITTPTPARLPVSQSGSSALASAQYQDSLTDTSVSSQTASQYQTSQISSPGPVLAQYQAFKQPDFTFLTSVRQASAPPVNANPSPGSVKRKRKSVMRDLIGFFMRPIRNVMG